MLRNSFVLAALAATLVASGASAAPVAVTTCGQTVSEGVLTGDLDCSAAHGFAVTVSPEGSLDLAGFQLTGTSDYSLDWQNAVYGGAVECLGECTVTGGGGTIVSPPGIPADTTYSIGIYADPSRKDSLVRLSDVSVSGWSSYGLRTRNADINNSEFTGNAYGIVVERSATLEGCTFTGNGEGAHLSRADVTNSTFDGNDTGFYVLRRVRLYSSSASNNQGFGYRGLKVIARGSALDNNCLTPYVGCADAEARRRPALINTTCGTSFNDLANADWNVCSDD